MVKPAQISEPYRSPTPRSFSWVHLPPSRVCACVFPFALRGRDCRLACVRVRERVRQNRDGASNGRQGLQEPVGTIISSRGYGRQGAV